MEERGCSHLGFVFLSAPEAASREFSARDLTGFPGKTIPQISILHLPPSCVCTSHTNPLHSKSLCLLHRPCCQFSQASHPPPHLEGLPLPLSWAPESCHRAGGSQDGQGQGTEGAEAEQRPGAQEGTHTLAQRQRDPKILEGSVQPREIRARG